MPDIATASTPAVQDAPAPAPEGFPESLTPLSDAVKAKWMPKKPDATPPPVKSDAKPDDTTPDKPDEDTSLDKPDKPKADDTKKPDEVPPVKPDLKPVKKTPFQLLHESEAEVKKLKRQIEEIQSKATADPSEHPKFKEVNTALESANKRIESLETELKFARYDKSADYKENYEKPYVNAYNAGRNAMGALDVTADDGNTRAGTAEDFDRLMAISDPRAQRAAAKAMFGDDTAALAEFITHRNEVSRLAEVARNSIADFEKKAGERDKQRADAMAQHQKRVAAEISTAWQKHTAETTTKYAQWFAPVEGDAEGNALLTAGYDLAKKAFSNLNLYDPKLTSEQRAELIAGQAAIINKGAAFDRLAVQFKNRGERIKALETELKQFKASEPGPGEGSRAKATAPMTAEDSFRNRFKGKLR